MCFKKGFIINSLYLFSIVFIILTGADFLTTTYALDNHIGYEANGIMSEIVNDNVKFITVKVVFTVVIIMLMSKCLKQSKKISHIGMRVIIFMMVFVVANNLMVISASAIDNAYYEPTCISPSYDSGYNQVWVSNNASSGKVAFIELNTAGAILSGNFRLENGSNILCAISSRTTETAGITRVFGTSEDGSVWYFDNNLVDYSLGFYTLSSVTFTCSGAGGNCNPIYKIGTLTATTINRKIAEDSAGNIYIADGATIYIFQKSNGYSQSIFYTLIAGTDYTAATIAIGVGTKTVDVIDLNIDSSNNVHVLVGTGQTCTSTCISVVYLSKTTIDAAGTRIYSDMGIASQTANYGGGTPNANEILTGGIVIDSTNATYNYTIIYLPDMVNGGTTLDHIGTPVLIHRTGSSSTTISSITLNSVGALGYYSNMLFVASWNEDIIRTYSTTYVGYVPPSEFVGVIELTYEIVTISSMDATYYNMSDIYLEYNVVINSIDTNNILIDLDNYRWMVRLTDPNGVTQNVIQSPACRYDGILDFTCEVSSTMGIVAPSNGWLAGTWSAKLYEINILVPNTALVATSAQFTVLNTSLDNQTIINPPFIPPSSGSGATALTVIDDWTAMFGLGVNPISKFMFAMMWITAFSVFGFVATKYNLHGGIMMALFPFTFFIYVAYIPLWTVVIITMIVGMRLFR